MENLLTLMQDHPKFSNRYLEVLIVNSIFASIKTNVQFTNRVDLTILHLTPFFFIFFFVFLALVGHF